MITTTREVFISVGQQFNERLIANLLEFNGGDLTIAEALIATKNEVNNFQKYFIYLFGDPAKKLAIPRADVRITRMNGVDITQSLDTLKALSRVNFDGVVTDPSGNVLTDFNGRLSTTVFDKNQNMRPVTLFTGQWADLSLDELLPKIKKMGYDGVELACWGDHFDVDAALNDDNYVINKWKSVSEYRRKYIPWLCIGDVSRITIEHAISSNSCQVY